MHDELLNELCKLSRWALFSLIPLTAAFCLTGYLSNSLTIVSIALESGFSIIIQSFAYFAIRAMVRADHIRFPYGAGKLENFSGFLYGALNIPIATYILIRSVQGLLSPTDQVLFGLAQLPMLPSLIRSLGLYYYARKLDRKFDSPLVHSYRTDFGIASCFDVLIIVALGIGLALNADGKHSFAVYVDPAFALCVALYLGWAAAGHLLRNFRALIDLPMSESEQLEIIRIIASEHAAYEQLGQIRTRRSGSSRFVEIELSFPTTTDVTQVSELVSRLEQQIKSALRDVKLSIIVSQTS
jgi:cation diffusion facilitator family transporter